MTAATKARRPKAKATAPYLAQLDPRELVAHPSNLRRDLGDLTELRASITAHGVWQALTVVPEEDGGHRIVAGHRRAAAAAEALEAGEWADGQPQTVPCLVRPDMVGLAPDQIVAMLVENDQRADLTESERAAGYAQLELFGLDVSEIARRTGRTQTHVQASLKLTKLGEAATAAADEGRLSLEDVVELAEFENDPKAMEKILKNVSSGWGIKHQAQEERRKRKVKEAVAAIKAELEAAGVTILKKPKEGWPYNCAMARVDQLETADGEKIDPETVKPSEGFGAIIEERYESADAVIVCEDPEAHGYKRTGHSYYKSPAQQAAEEERKKAAEELRERLKASSEVRRRFVVEKYGNAKAAKAMLDDAMRAAYVTPGWMDRVDGDLLQDLAGGDLSDWQTAGRDRLTRLVVARFVAAEETNVVHLVEGRAYLCKKSWAIAWLDRLVSDGYELSDAEAQLRAELIADEEERRREEEEGEAERLRYEAEEAEEERDVVDVHLPEEDLAPEDLTPEEANEKAHDDAQRADAAAADVECAEADLEPGAEGAE